MEMDSTERDLGENTPSTQYTPSPEYIRLQEQIAAQGTAINELLGFIQAQRRNTEIPHVTTGVAGAPPLPPVVYDPKPKGILPKLSEFDGKRSEWSQWCEQAKMKLKIDGKTIGDPENQFAYIYACLRGSAAQATLAFIQTSPLEQRTGFSLLEYMDNIYGDPVKQQRAIASLSTIRQKDREPFYLFLPKFESTLATAGGMSWPDTVKKAMLNKAINNEMRSYCIGRDYSTSFRDFVTQLLTIGADIATSKTLASNTSYGNGNHSRNRSTRVLNDMDWEPTRVNTQGPQKHAKWVSEETLKYRRQNQLCLRCGNTGHRIGDCQFLPARRINKVSFDKEKAEAEEEDYFSEPEKE